MAGSPGLWPIMLGKPYKGIHSPECGNYPGSLWEDVSLDCPGEGEFILNG